MLGHRDVTGKVRRATSRIFENGGVIVFHVDTLSLFFPVNEAVMWFLFSSRIPLSHIPTEKVSAVSAFLSKYLKIHLLRNHNFPGP